MASNPFVSVSITGYNANPPTDDGAKTAANAITWAKHKTKIGDPLKTAIEALDAATESAFDTISAYLVPFVGDFGSGGVSGFVPAPDAGDAANNRYLSADGTWKTPAGAGSVTSVGTGSGLTGGPITGAGTIALADITAYTLLANLSASSAAPSAYTLQALFNLLDTFVGDSGSGGTKGLVPAPAAGEDGYYLKGDGSWAQIPTYVASVTAGNGLSGGTITDSGTISLAEIDDQQIMANLSGSTGIASGHPPETIMDLFDPFVGDSGSGGIKGLVPAPAAGDAAAAKVLYADGTWAAPPGAGGGEANTASNLGGGEGVFASKSVLDLQFKSLVAGFAVSLSSDSNELTIALNETALTTFVGDSGSGGAKGLVPAPSAGDAAAGYALMADGTWGSPSSGGGTAADISYDNGASGLTATDAQGAIDEVASYLPILAYSKRAHVKQTSATSIPNATFTALSWATEVEDVGGWFTWGSPTRLTVPSGVNAVILSGQVKLSAAGGTNGVIKIEHFNSSNVSQGTYLDGLNFNLQWAGTISTVPIAVNSGDYFIMSVSQNSGSTRSSDTSICRFTVAQIA